MSYSHETFLSPFTWRYGSDEMRAIWSDVYRRKLWRRIWVALAEAQEAAGLVTPEQVEDLRAHQNEINLERAEAIEAEIHHDLMAEVRTFAEQCTIGKGIIHLGATSSDIEDNADTLRIRESFDLLLRSLKKLLTILAERIEGEADQVCMAFTHLQPAEPTTVGYRLATYGQDLLADYETLKLVRWEIRGKGFKGAVGTSASYQQLLSGSGMTPQEMEAHIMAQLNLPVFHIATQTYPRRQDWDVVNALAGLGMSIYKMAFDLRVLQSPAIGEWSEPFAAQQVGSSAMPFKRNPINAENLDSLARYLAALPRVVWDNAAHSLLERTLDDSANRRLVLPQAFLGADELVNRATRIIGRLHIDERAIRGNLETYGIFAATERLLIEGVRQGGDRQELHEIIRKHSLAAWEAIGRGEVNPLATLLSNDPTLIRLMSAGRMGELLNAETHIGDAPERARRLASAIRAAVG